MENGKYLDSERGTPQGNGASPVLANVYLHYVLDNWFDVIVKRQCKGECYLIRYCDDFVCCFQNQYEAEVFKQRLKNALGIWTGTGGRKDEDFRIREVCQAEPESKRRKKTRYL